MIKRKYIPILLIISLMTTILFSGCSENEAEESPSEKTRTELLREFSELSEVPRISGGDSTEITDYITKRLKKMNIKVTKDDAGNLIAEKPATAEYSDAPTTIIHTNIDMIPKSDPSIIFDPSKDSITPIVNEDSNVITGNHTNLGASSGLGIASTFLILSSATNHGPIKVIYTVNGETDMSGTKNINPDFIDGDYLINLNNNKSGVIETGSAYSSICEVDENIKKHDSNNKYAYVLVADGFVGGDSGEGAKNNQGNPIKFLAEVMALAKAQGLMFEVADMNGGENIQSIPKSATATITVNKYEKGKISSIFSKVKKDYLNEHETSDPDAKLDIIETTVPDSVLTDDSASNLISFLYSLNDGIYNDKSHTTASSNIGSISFSEDNAKIKIFVQGKMEASIQRIIDEHTKIAEISKLTITVDDFIHGFYTAKTSPLATGLEEIYKETFDISTEVAYRPCRSELGFFQEKNSNLSMVSIGPSIINEDSTMESVDLETIDIPATVILTFLANQK